MSINELNSQNPVQFSNLHLEPPSQIPTPTQNDNSHSYTLNNQECALNNQKDIKPNNSLSARLLEQRDNHLRTMINYISNYSQNKTENVARLFSETNELIEACLNSENENLKKAGNDMLSTIDKFSPCEESYRDILNAIGHFFAYIFAALGIFSNICARIYPNVYNACQKMRNTSLNETIRQPLFNGIKEAVLEQMNQPSNLDVQTKLKYIYLLSSVDKAQAKEFLSNDPGKNLLLNSSLDYTTFVCDLDEAVMHGTIDSNLQLLQHMDTLSVTDRQNLAAALNNDTNIMKTLAGIRENLTLGQQFGQIGDERERLPFSESPFVRYHIPGYRSSLYTISAYTQNVFFDAGAAQSPEYDSRANYNFNIPNPRNITFNDGLYQSNDGLLRAGVRIGDLLDLQTAENFGLVTPEKVQALLAQYPDKKRTDIIIEPVFIAYNSTRNVYDALGAMENILDCTPTMLKHAQHLTEAINANVESHNATISNEQVTDTNANTPHLRVVVHIGNSLGGMTAHAMGAKYNCASIGFNPLGTGTGTRNFVGEGKCKQANDNLHANCHQSFATEGDWVSDNESSKLAFWTKKPYIGQSYIMSHCNPDAANIADIHISYPQNIAQNIDRYFGINNE